MELVTAAVNTLQNAQSTGVCVHVCVCVHACASVKRLQKHNTTWVHISSPSKKQTAQTTIIRKLGRCPLWKSVGNISMIVVCTVFTMANCREKTKRLNCKRMLRKWNHIHINWFVLLNKSFFQFILPNNLIILYGNLLQIILGIIQVYITIVIITIIIITTITNAITKIYRHKKEPICLSHIFFSQNK